MNKTPAAGPSAAAVDPRGFFGGSSSRGRRVRSGWTQPLQVLALLLLLLSLTWAVLAHGGVQATTRNGLVALAGLQGLLGAVLIWRRRPLPNPFGLVGVGLFLAYALWQVQRADIPWVAWEEALQVFTYAMAFWTGLLLWREPGLGRGLLWTAGALVGVLCLFGLYQFLTRDMQIWEWVRPGQYGRRASGTYINPNHFAGLLGMLLPVLAAFVGVGRLPFGQKAALSGLFFLGLIGLGTTLSRGGWLAGGLALGVLLGVLLARESSRKVGWAILAQVVLVGVLWISVSAVGIKRVEHLLSHQQERDLRLSLWTAAEDLWRLAPVTGIGPGHFDERFGAVRTPELQRRAGYAHNEYLQTLAEWGGVGLILGLGVVGWGACRGLRDWKHLNPGPGNRSNAQALVLGAAAAWVAVLVHAVTDFNLHIPANALWAAVLLSVLGGAGGGGKAGESCGPKSARRRAGQVVWSLVLGGAGIFMLVQAGQRHASLQLLETARGAGAAPDRQEAYLAYLDRNPEDFEVCLEAYNAWVKQTGVGSAMALMPHLQAAMVANPYNPYLRISAGLVYMEAVMLAQAGPLFESAYQLDPFNHEILTWYGWYLTQVGEAERGRFHLEQARNWGQAEARRAVTILKTLPEPAARD